MLLNWRCWGGRRTGIRRRRARKRHNHNDASGQFQARPSDFQRCPLAWLPDRIQRRPNRAI